MCNSPSVDNSSVRAADRDAAEARTRETQRKASIAAGRDAISRTFSGDVIPTGILRTVNPAWQAWQDAGRAAGGELTNADGGGLGDYEMTPEPQQYFDTHQFANNGRGFNDAYFDRTRQATIDAYQPELARQFEGAKNNLAYGLARQGLTRSTEAGRQQGALNEGFQVESGRIAARANEASNTARSNVERERSGLISQLEATNDVDGASSGALARSAFLAQPTANYQPLGDVFAGLLSAGSSTYAGRQDARLGNALSGPMAANNPRSTRQSEVR